MDEIEAWISEPKDEEMENTQTEQQNEKKKIKEVREGVGGQTDWNDSHRQLASLITWTTALSNSMKLSRAVRGHPRRVSHGGGSDRMCPLEKGMANHFSILALRTPWTVWKGKKIGHWKMNSPGR